MVTMFGQIAQAEPTGTLGGSALASWTPFWGLIGVFAAITVALFVVGPPSPTPWPMLQPPSRIPNALPPIPRTPAWAALTIGTAPYGLLVAGPGFHPPVPCPIPLGPAQ